MADATLRVYCQYTPHMISISLQYSKYFEISQSSVNTFFVSRFSIYRHTISNIVSAGILTANIDL
jgi:hypothetical protein